MVTAMTRAGRNAPCPCGSGKKYKLCCLPAEADGVRGKTALHEIETIDATGHGCDWRILERVGPEGTATGELVEHLCNGERFEVQATDGWLMSGKRVPMYLALEALPPPLYEWAIRQSLGAVSDEDVTPFGLEVARILLLAGTVVDLVGDLRAPRRGLKRILSHRRQQAA
jgi:hypothetical protein